MSKRDRRAMALFAEVLGLKLGYEIMYHNLPVNELFELGKVLRHSYEPTTNIFGCLEIEPFEINCN